jgi:hypothetical protein
MPPGLSTKLSNENAGDKFERSAKTKLRITAVMKQIHPNPRTPLTIKRDFLFSFQRKTPVTPSTITKTTFRKTNKKKR